MVLCGRGEIAMVGNGCSQVFRGYVEVWCPDWLLVSVE